MHFIKSVNNGVIVLTVELIRATLKESDDFKSALINDIQTGNKKFVVDLSECEFIDSTFLGSLVVALKKVTSQGGDLRLVGFKPGVQSMFELTRMHRVFETYSSKTEAINSFN
jgi:anti-anti-sigma factor